MVNQRSRWSMRTNGTVRDTRCLRCTRVAELRGRIKTTESNIDDAHHVEHIGHPVTVDISRHKGTIGIGIDYARLPTESDVYTLYHIEHIADAVALRIGMAVASARPRDRG